MARPNFFLVGAPKAGTTSLYHYLGQHPDIYVSPLKEPTFFALESLGANAQGVVRTAAEYDALFRGVTRERAIGEASVAYLASTRAPQRIAEFNPDARIIMVLRNPADLLFSYYKWARGFGATSATFRTWLAQEVVREAQADPPRGRLWTVRYGKHLRRWVEQFPRERVLVMLFDDYQRNTKAALRSLFSFLQVDPDFAVDASIRHNETKVPRLPFLHRLTKPVRKLVRPVVPKGMRSWWIDRLRHASPLELAVEERRAVLGLCGEDIRELEELLDLDLSAWRS